MQTISNTTVCEQQDRVANMHTGYSQQLEVYAQQGISNKDPRKATVEDLRDLILKRFYTPDDYLLIGIDANESSQKSKNLQFLTC